MTDQEIISQFLTLIFEEYLTEAILASIAGLIATITTAASIVTNNFHTEEWRIGPILDWLASTNKKAKFTGDYLADDKIDHAQKVNEPRSAALKFLSKFS